jgi:hypothetical protein
MGEAYLWAGREISLVQVEPWINFMNSVKSEELYDSRSEHALQQAHKMSRGEPERSI